MVVHTTTLLYYLWEPHTGAFALIDAFGRTLFPLRYVMWTISVTNMSLSVYFVVESILNKHVKGMPLWRPEDADALHARLVSTMQACVMMFATGFLASVIKLDAATAGALALLPNGLMAVLSCVFMYIMLFNLNDMLFRAQENALVKVSGAHTMQCMWHNPLSPAKALYTKPTHRLRSRTPLGARGRGVPPNLPRAHGNHMRVALVSTRVVCCRGQLHR